MQRILYWKKDIFSFQEAEYGEPALLWLTFPFPEGQRGRQGQKNIGKCVFIIVVVLCLYGELGKIFFHLCLQDRFSPVWETSVSHDHAGPRNNPFKGGRKRIYHEPVHAG